MRHCRLYCPDLRVGSNRLRAEETHHAGDVLRLGRGDQVVLFNGAGGEAEGVIRAAHPSAMEVDVGEVIVRPFDLAVRLTLAVAMTRAHRQNYLVEKCTELGVGAIWPIRTERGVTRPGEAAVEKWTRRAIEAVKQCGRAWVPTIESPQELKDAVARRGEFGLAVAAQASAEGRSLMSAMAGARDGEAVLVFIGPEGGWSDAERGVFLDAGIGSVSLGSTVLRTETAAVTACTAAVWRTLGCG